MIVLFVLIVKPIRTIKVMESIAKNELMDEPFYLFTDKYENLYKNVEGPIIIDRQDRVQFTWYKVLEWGDTASISAFVYKNFFIEFTGVFRSQNPSSVTADTKWYYVYVPEGISKFTDIIPKCCNRNVTDVSVFKLSPNKEKTVDSINFIINPSRLLFFLKKGHFQIVEKNDIYTIIDFYEPIANIVHRHTNESIPTMSAKVFFLDSLEVLILPFVVPVELRNN